MAGNPTADPRHRLDAGPFHMVNLVLHTLSVLFVFVILRRLTGHEWAAGAGALLFGLHPLQVEAASGHVLFKQNRLGEAVARYRRALQIDPDAADVQL